MGEWELRARKSDQHEKPLDGLGAQNQTSFLFSQLIEDNKNNAQYLQKTHIQWEDDNIYIYIYYILLPK